MAYLKNYKILIEELYGMLKEVLVLLTEVVNGMKTLKGLDDEEED